MRLRTNPARLSGADLAAYRGSWGLLRAFRYPRRDRCYCGARSLTPWTSCAAVGICGLGLAVAYFRFAVRSSPRRTVVPVLSS